MAEKKKYFEPMSDKETRKRVAAGKGNLITRAVKSVAKSVRGDGSKSSPSKGNVRKNVTQGSKSESTPAKKETRTAGYSGAKGSTGLPPRHSKNEMGTSGSKERRANATKKPPMPTKKPSKAKVASKSKTPAKKKTSGSDKDWYNKAVRRGFGSR